MATLNEQVKELAAKSKFWKYATLTVMVVGGFVLLMVGMPEQGNQMIQIGKEVATVEVTDGEVTGVISATAPVTVEPVSVTIPAE